MSIDLEDARSAYESFSQGQLELLSEWFDPDVEWIEPPELPGARSYTGRARVLRYLASIRDLWEEFDVTVERSQETPQGLRLFIHIRARARGARVEDRVIHDIALRDGRATRIEVHQRA